MVAGEVTDFYCLALLITHLSEFPVSTLLYRYPRMACFLDWVLYTRVLTVFPQLPGKVCLRTCSKPLKTNTPLNSHNPLTPQNAEIENDKAVRAEAGALLL